GSPTHPKRKLMVHLGAFAIAVCLLGTGLALPQGQVPAVDLHGDPLPAGAVARLGSVAFYHEFAHQIAYSGNGKILASSDDRIIRLWDAATGRGLGQYQGGRAFALSADGTRLAASATVPDKGLLSIWDTASGKELRQLALHSEVTVAAFSPDGKLL